MVKQKQKQTIPNYAKPWTLHNPNQYVFHKEGFRLNLIKSGMNLWAQEHQEQGETSMNMNGTWDG